jgi:hypothetical protein
MRFASEPLFHFSGWTWRMAAPGAHLYLPLTVLAATVPVARAAADEAPGLPAWDSQVQVRPAAPPRLVGDQACASCHADKVASYHQTGHYRTSSWPSRASVHGHFDAGSNTMPTANPGLSFVMEARDGGLFEAAYLKTSPTEAAGRVVRAEMPRVPQGRGLPGVPQAWPGDRGEVHRLPHAAAADRKDRLEAGRQERPAQGAQSPHCYLSGRLIPLNADWVQACGGSAPLRLFP